MTGTDTRSENHGSPTVDTNTTARTTPPTVVVAPVPGTESDIRQPEIGARTDTDTRAQANTGSDTRANTGSGTQANTAAQANGNAQAPMRRAEVDLSTVGDAKMDALAVFEESSNGVSVVVRIEDATPGTRSVRVYERADCDDLDTKALGRPFTALKRGTLTVNANGKGTLEMNAPNASLKPDDRSSLLGKTIVVQEPSANSDPIACGVIRIDTGYADKAGRMTDTQGNPPSGTMPTTR